MIPFSKTVFLLGFCAVTALPPCEAADRFVITDFGAVADGKTLNTEAIQKAVDAAAEKGGTVVIPAAPSSVDRFS